MSDGLVIRGRHIGRQLAWTVQRKFNPKFAEKDTRVEGLAIFHNYFTSHHVLVSATAEQYINGIFPRDRAIIAYGQNIIIWLTCIRFQIIAFFGQYEWANIFTANPFMFVKRPNIWAEALFFTILLSSYFGKNYYLVLISTSSFS